MKMRKRNGLKASCRSAVAICGLMIAVAATARANTLAGDSLTVSLACYNNAACSGATAISPLVVALDTFVAPVGSAGFTFNSTNLIPDNFSQTVVGSFTNFINNTTTLSRFTIVFSIENATGGLSNIASGGFLGLYVTAASPTAQPLLVTFADVNAATTDGFTLLNDVTYPPNAVPLEALNFQGLTGNSFSNNTAVLDISDVTQQAAVPEPSSGALLATGLLGLLGLGWHQRRREAA